MIHKWQLGDRVTRQIYLDDGTWSRRGDVCLKDSPLRHGTVFERSLRRNDEVIVIWDNSTERKYYLDHGLDAEE